MPAHLTNPIVQAAIASYHINSVVIQPEENQVQISVSMKDAQGQVVGQPLFQVIPFIPDYKDAWQAATGGFKNKIYSVVLGLFGNPAATVD